MRNRKWDQDFEQINQANVNRFSVNRDGQRQYDSGYRNDRGMTSFDQNMNDRNYQHRNEWENEAPSRYAAQPEQYNYAPGHRQAQPGYHERQPQHNRHPEQNAANRGFMGRMGEYLQHGRERVEHIFDRFGNRHHNEGRDAGLGYNQPDYYRNLYRQQNQQFRNQDSRNEHQNRQQRYPNRHPRGGFENSPYFQGNQGQEQGNRYQSADYSGRSSYRLLDTYSGYGQSGGSYASDRDSD